VTVKEVTTVVKLGFKNSALKREYGFSSSIRKQGCIFPSYVCVSAVDIYRYLMLLAPSC
jgi:hypothetical protein